VASGDSGDNGGSGDNSDLKNDYSDMCVRVCLSVCLPVGHGLNSHAQSSDPA
jgi:hypothetical protein